MAMAWRWQGSYEWGNSFACCYRGMVRFDPTDCSGVNRKNALMTLSRGDVFTFWIDNKRYSGSLLQNPDYRVSGKGSTIDLITNASYPEYCADGTFYIDI